ncbi:hypothetical protein AMTR_s00061p00112270 [Amborella trichopoda]|uniref:Amino acid transporter transmembrane domain-containing protein n=1 Tax=Amborella trichopoda TaxID=13333 RepID=U5DA60_AMBTC|nr:hypothetical protein AMTR_s00061p00112270 [Amborella trichopoda]
MEMTDKQEPLIADAQVRCKRTGDAWTATAHIITAVVGSGVLSLAWCVAQLGWIAGPLAILGFAVITLISSYLLADCCRSPNSEKGHIRHITYIDAIDFNLGKKSVWICGLVQQLGICGTAIAYTITSAMCLRAIQRSNCFHIEGHEAACKYGDTAYMLTFGVVQLVCSQIPDFHNMGWLSIVAAAMSFSYSSIGFGLGLAKTIENGKIYGNITGVAMSSTVAKLSRVCQALGDIAFAYPYSIVLIEIQDTLKAPPPENHTMKRASMTAIVITTFFYLCCGCFGYASFGDSTPGNLLTGFGFYEPYWLIDFANACIVLHLVGGYQVYSQPLFAFVEKWLIQTFPTCALMKTTYTLHIPFIPTFQLNLLRLCFRTAYVVSTTGLAMFFPYFNQVLGVLGALNFWPIAVYFPIQMYIVQKNVQTWTSKWLIFQTFSCICLVASVIALTGSIQGIVSEKTS